ncbi:MAG: hypothetical protein C0623_13055 [Desulfuromonas sp.]|nr:MAG: hypothetical protein C0623_13055 [Desulfuromonas sp.]
MRLALKHQIILAPATVLLLLALLLGFMQLSYWDLTLKRQASRKLGTVFLSLAEADLATQRIYRLAVRLSREDLVNVARVSELAMYYQHLDEASERIISNLGMNKRDRTRFRETVNKLNPEFGFDAERFVEAIGELRPQFVSFSEQMQERRATLSKVQSADIDELVTRTTLVSIIVLGTAILLGIFLSLYFARRILRRIQGLSDSARRIAEGELVAPTPPEKMQDELDELTLSISRMTDKLIRVVSTEKLLEGAEEERRRIAMDIHDQTLADLATVKRDVEVLKEKEDCRDEAGRLQSNLDRAIHNLREVMDNLHPQTLDILGLGAALESHLERHFSGPDLPEYHFHQTSKAEDLQLPKFASLAIYRIASEAIHNIIRHANANRYEVNLDVNNGHFSLVIEDNGRGFDPAAVNESGRRGLHNIKERARAIGGQVSWKASRFSSGTRFELTINISSLKQEV